MEDFGYAGARQLIAFARIASLARSRNLAVSGSARSRLSPKSKRACSFTFRSPTSRSMFSSVLAMGAGGRFRVPACSASAAVLMTPLLIFVGIAPRSAVASSSHMLRLRFRAPYILLAPPRHRSGLGCAIEWPAPSHRLGVWTFTLLRSLANSIC